MWKIRVECMFSAAHRLLNYEGPCGRLHGHNWKVVVVLEGDELNRNGMLMDFRTVKQIIAEFDHKVLLKSSDPLVEVLRKADQEVIELSVNPTCEDLARIIAWKILRYETKVQRVTVRLYETPNQWAEYTVERTPESLTDSTCTVWW